MANKSFCHRKVERSGGCGLLLELVGCKVSVECGEKFPRRVRLVVGGGDGMVLKRKARDIMTRTVITAKPDTLVTDVMSLFLRWHISGLPIVDGDGKLLGIVTEADVVNFAISGDTASTTAGEIMTKQVETYTQDTLVVEIVNRFAAKRIRRVPVVEEGKVVGILSWRDIIREMNRLNLEAKVRVG